MPERQQTPPIPAGGSAEQAALSQHTGRHPGRSEAKTRGLLACRAMIIVFYRPACTGQVLAAKT